MNKSQRDTIAERIARTKKPTNRISNPYNYKKLFINLAFIIAIFWGMYTVDASAIRINFYDENTLLAIPTVTITDSNGSSYTSDVNGLWDVNLTGAKSLDISKTGYATRPLDFNFVTDANYNFLLNPISLDSNIQFLVKDENNSVWNSKYLQFKKYTSVDNNLTINQVSSFTISYADTGNQYAGLKIKPNIDIIISTVNKASDTDANNVIIYDNNINILATANFTGNTATFTGVNRIKLLKDTNYYIAAGKSFISYTRRYNAVSFPITNTYVNFIGGIIGGTYVSDTAYNITDINVLIPQYVIINSILTSSTGYATASISSSGDYNALLYDENAVLRYTYTKTAVTVNKPLNEKSLASISPYDIYVGGLLIYNDTNRTEASRLINIFAGTTGVYTFGVVDYNATVSDQKYIQRIYSAQVPMGTSYTSTQTIQPYLNLKTEGIIPSAYVLDSLNNPVAGVNILISKYINGVLTVVESGLTQSTGGFSFSAYPLDTYYISIVYNGVNKGTYSIQPRTDADVYTFVIDTSTPQTIPNTLIITTNFTGTPQSINIDTNNLYIIANVLANLDYLDSYNLYFYQNSVLKASTSSAITGLSTDINFMVDSALLDRYIPTGTIKLIVNYTDTNGVSGTQDFYFTVYLAHDNRNLVTNLLATTSDLGQPLSILIAILITGLLIGALALTGFNIGATGLTMLGVLCLGAFMFFGFLDVGVKVLGTDIGRFFFVIMCLTLIYFMIRGNQQ